MGLQGLQQAEGYHLGEKSMRMHRQALRRAVVSVPRRDRFTSMLVVLLTGTSLFGTPAFGGQYSDRFYELCTYEKVLSCASPPTISTPDGGVQRTPPAADCCVCDGTCSEAQDPKLVSCPDGYTSDPQGNCVRKCNSKKFRGCLAESTKAFERVYEQCRGKKVDIITDETEIREGSPAYDFMISVGGDATSSAMEILLEYLVKGRVDIVRGSYGFLADAALETYKLLRDYPEWSGDLDQCLDLADKIKTFVDNDCARQAGCWPGQ